MEDKSTESNSEMSGGQRGDFSPDQDKIETGELTPELKAERAEWEREAESEALGLQDEGRLPKTRLARWREKMLNRLRKKEDQEVGELNPEQLRAIEEMRGKQVDFKEIASALAGVKEEEEIKARLNKLLGTEKEGLEFDRSMSSDQKYVVGVSKNELATADRLVLMGDKNGELNPKQLFVVWDKGGFARLLIAAEELG